MDQLACVAGVEGAALLHRLPHLDSGRSRPAADEVEVVVVHSGVTRSLAGSAYAERAPPVRQRRADHRSAARRARSTTWSGIADPVRARPAPGT